MREPTYVYHVTEEAKVVDKAQAEELYKKGWADTPAAFLTTNLPIEKGEDHGKSTDEDTCKISDEKPLEKPKKGPAKRVLAK